MVLNQLVPSDTRSSVLTSLQRITAPISDFIRGNPIVSTAIIGIGTTGLVAGVAAVRRARKKKPRKKAVKRGVAKRKKPSKKKRITHRSPRHKGHKRVSFINKKTGKRVSFLVRRKGGVSHRKRRKKR